MYLCRDVIAGAEIENMDALAVEGYMYYTYVNTSLGRIPLYVIAMAQGTRDGRKTRGMFFILSWTRTRASCITCLSWDRRRQRIWHGKGDSLLWRRC